MGHFYTLNTLLQPPHTIRRVDVVLAATPNLASSGQRRRCSTATIDNCIITLMLCPSVLSTPILRGYFYAYNAILHPPHTMRRVDVVLVATSNHASSGLIRRCSTSSIEFESMALMQCPFVLSGPTLRGHFYACKAILQPPHTTRR